MAFRTFAAASLLWQSATICPRYCTSLSRLSQLAKPGGLCAAAAGRCVSRLRSPQSQCSTFSSSPQPGAKPSPEADIGDRPAPSAECLAGSVHSTVRDDETGKVVPRKNDASRATYSRTKTPMDSNIPADLPTTASSVHDKLDVQAVLKKPSRTPRRRVTGTAQTRTARTKSATDVPLSLEEETEKDNAVDKTSRKRRTLGPTATVVSMLHASILRRTYAKFEHNGALILVELQDMSEIVGSLGSQGVSVDAIVASASDLFTHPCKDVRLAVALLMLEERPVTPVSVKALLGERRGGDSNFLSNAGVAASYRLWREISPVAVQRTLADELGVNVTELDCFLAGRVQDPVGLLDKIHLLKQQSDVQANPRDFAVHSQIFDFDIERIAAAVVQLRKANVNPITLMQVYTMVAYRRIASSSGPQMIADRQRELAKVFGCDVASVAAICLAIWDHHAVSVSGVQSRVSQLAAMGVQPLDVLRVPHIVSFSGADIAAAAAQVDSLPVEKRDVLKSDSFKFLNALVYFADKVNLFQMTRGCDDFFKKKNIRKLIKKTNACMH